MAAGTAVATGASAVVEKSKILSIDEMLAADDVSYVTAEAWGGTIRFGSLDAGTMLDFAEGNQGPGKKTALLRLLIKSLVDENGKRIGELSMLEKFKSRNAATITKLGDIILHLNGFGNPDQIDITTHIASAELNPEKLQALSSKLRSLADQVDEAGVDPEKLKAITSAKPENVIKND